MEEPPREAKMQTFAREFFRRTPKGVHKTIGDLRVIGQETRRKADVDFVWNGSEVVVVKHQNQERFVAAFNYRDLSENKAKVIFYTQRVLATLFPHNFPRFRAVYQANPQNAFHGASERQMIVETETKVKFPFTDKISETMEGAGMNVWFDNVAPNFILGADGGEYYVDTPNVSHFGWNKSRALGFIETFKHPDGKPLDNADKKSIRLALDHLEELGVFDRKHD